MCGAARYEISLKGVHTLACHCRQCQKHMGTPYSIFVVVPANQFNWLSKPSHHISISDRATRLFCGTCGTCIKWEGKNTPDEAEVNAMTLDDPSGLTINEEIYVRTRLPWIGALEGVPQYETTRPNE